MKKLSIAIAWCLTLMLGVAYGQENPVTDKKDFLKNYKAPDFKQRRFDIGLNLNGGSQSKYNLNNSAQFRESTQFGYSQFANKQDYQGHFSTVLNSNIEWNKSDVKEVIYSKNGINLSTENRFYFKPKWFVGIYGDLRVQHSYSKQAGSPDNTSIGLELSPTLAIGRGRLEPVQYARSAMDIERQLKRGGRLASPYSLAQLNDIANELAVINNVRFYDFRLRRIEQLEAIDQILREIGGISEFDMTYFAHLADAYLYAQNFQRFSGFRNEIGLTNATNLNYNFSNEKHNNIVNSALYYSLSYNLASSYTVQHNFGVALLAGASYYDYSGQYEQVINLDSWFVANYELGLFPTTRTNFNFGVNVGSGVSFPGEIYANGAVYLSPQFRLSFEANYGPGSDSIGHPFRNISNWNRQSNDFVLGGAIQLRYAIF